MSNRTGTAIATVGNAKSAASMLKAGLPSLRAALPRHVRPEQYVQVVLTLLQAQPRLLECTRASFFMAVLKCAQLGLEPGRTCHIIPYRNRDKGVIEANFTLDFKGMIELHLRSGHYRHIEAVLVYEGEHFVYERGLVPKLDHSPKPPPGDSLVESNQKIIAVYTIARATDGGDDMIDVMWRVEFEAVRKKARTQDVWGDPQAYGEMIKKTVIRRASKGLRSSVELSEAVALDDRVHSGEGQEGMIAMMGAAIEDVTGGIVSKDETTSATDDLKARLEAKPEAQPEAQPTKAKVCAHDRASVGDDSLVYCLDCGEELAEGTPPALAL